MKERRFARIKKAWIGWEVEYCGMPEKGIGWAESPSRWCLTQKGAERYARRRHAKRTAEPVEYELEF